MRLLNRTSTRLTIALSAPAFAVTALAATGGLSPSAAAQPVKLAYRVSAVHITTGHAVRATAAQSATLLTTQATAAARRHSLGRNREIAWKMMYKRFHWRPKYQFRSLNKLWDRESSWNVHAANPYSGAYGIPQAVPGSKMSTAGPNWQNSARTQIRWGLRYIKSRYGKPTRAWAHECAYGWY